MAELFRSIGPVQKFRLVTEGPRRRSKGYGFVEFQDQESATRAVQALNGVNLRGRKLVVYYTNDDGSRDRRQHSTPPPPPPTGPEDYSQRQLQPGQPAQTNTDFVPGNLVINDNISRTLSHFPPLKLFEIMGSLRSVVAQDASQAVELLRSNPTLTYTLVQAMLLMGLVDGTVVSQAVGGGIPNMNAQPAVQPNVQPVMDPRQQNSRNQYNGRSQYNQPSPSPPPPPPPQAPPQQYVQPPANLPPELATIVQQVLSLTDEQINVLPADQKRTLLDLRDKYRRGIYT